MVMSMKDNEILIREVTWQEVTNVIKNRLSDKSLGLAGIWGMFYKRFWNNIGRDVLQF